MIDVKTTLLSTIKKHIDNLRFLAINDHKVFKKIMYLIVLDELYDWSNYLEDKLAVLKKLLDLRTNYILNHKEFIIERYPDTVTSEDTKEVYVIPEMQPYVNVNTPQTQTEWQRIWDDPDLKEISSTISKKSITSQPFTPDYSCPLEIIYYPSTMYGGIERDSSGAPKIANLNNLTTCEKMNIFVDRETGIMYYLKPSECSWQTIKSVGVLPEGTTIKWSLITEAPTIYSGIMHELNTTGHTVDVELKETGSVKSSGIELASSSDIGGLL